MVMRSPCCVCARAHPTVCVSSSNNFEFQNQCLWNFVHYIMAPDPISLAYFINPSHQYQQYSLEVAETEH
jgi:hypothetical protein